MSKNGKKPNLWGRLQSAVADNQLRGAVRLMRCRRDPQIESGSQQPDAETVGLHEMTHCPRMPWCNACVASRSREDNRRASAPKENGVIPCAKRRNDSLSKRVLCVLRIILCPIFLQTSATVCQTIHRSVMSSSVMLRALWVVNSLLGGLISDAGL